jgi:hypothetical protein
VAHLLALLMSLVHLTGDAALLTLERRYVRPADGELGGYSPEIQADIRARAVGVVQVVAEADFRRAIRIVAPRPPSPTTITAQVAGSGTVPLIVRYATGDPLV